ncbi:unnamed protein product [Amoebophrya sp. A120]|nr:unnamed protein product [Amoebophrya sp. A120]|eukprot:GSA120T00022758001.1
MAGAQDADDFFHVKSEAFALQPTRAAINHFVHTGRFARKTLKLTTATGSTTGNGCRERRGAIQAVGFIIIIIVTGSCSAAAPAAYGQEPATSWHQGKGDQRRSSGEAAGPEAFRGVAAAFLRFSANLGHSANRATASKLQLQPDTQISFFPGCELSSTGHSTNEQGGAMRLQTISE